jgi:small subunit ribosomal protein S16
MGLVIRLRRHGSRKKPFFRIVVADSRSPRDGRFVDQIGTYDPSLDPPKVTLKKAEADLWLKSGAQPSETVRKLMQLASTAT